MRYLQAQQSLAKEKECARQLQQKIVRSGDVKAAVNPEQPQYEVFLTSLEAEVRARLAEIDAEYMMVELSADEIDSPERLMVLDEAALVPEIKAMIAAGKSHREIEEFFGLTGDRPVHNLLKQERKKEKKIEAGIIPRPQGRPRKDSLPRDIAAEQAYEIKRLKMENKLLRDFLQLTGRK